MIKRYDFDNFIVTNKNDFAYSAAKAITQFLGTSYNPLFIYGSAGVGKTHLLYAIMNEIIKKDKNNNALCIDIATVKNIQDLKIKDINVLLIDNFESIKENYKMQKDLVKKFKQLLPYDKQIVISSREPLNELNILYDLKAQVEKGLYAEIEQ